MSLHLVGRKLFKLKENTAEALRFTSCWSVGVWVGGSFSQAALAGLGQQEVLVSDWAAAMGACRRLRSLGATPWLGRCQWRCLIRQRAMSRQASRWKGSDGFKMGPRRPTRAQVDTGGTKEVTACVSSRGRCLQSTMCSGAAAAVRA